VTATDRAGDIVNRIEALMRKAPLRKKVLDLNEAILEVIALSHSERPALRYARSLHLACRAFMPMGCNCNK
jgi:hypothetical protein